MPSAWARAAPMLLALAILGGCTGAEPSSSSPVTTRGDSSQALIATGTEVPTSSPTTTTQLPTTIPAPILSDDEAGEPETTETAPATATPVNVSDDASGSSTDAEDAPEERDVPRYPREPRFGTHRAPEWPFSGLIQLWYDNWSSEAHWYLRYWHWPSVGVVDSAVRLPGFDTDCLGQAAAVLHGPDGIEIGIADGTNPITYRIPWDDGARTTTQPTERFTTEVATRPSSIEVRTDGDLLHLAAGQQSQTYALRQPARTDGEWWIAQARHDGDVFVITVHPAHLPCFSGVTWLSDARTGELLGCGTSTHAVRFVSPTPASTDNLVLPDSEAIGTYMSCPRPLDFEGIVLPSR